MQNRFHLTYRWVTLTPVELLPVAGGNDLLGCGPEAGELCAAEVRTEIRVFVEIEGPYGYACSGRERYVVLESYAVQLEES